MTWKEELISAVGRFTGRFLSGPAAHSEVVWQAMVSTAAALMESVSSSVASDIRDYRDELKKRMEARTQTEQAEAAKVIAEAAEATNKATRSKRTRAIAKLDEEAKSIANAKSQAEVEKIRAETEQIRLSARSEAMKNLADAMQNLKTHGGEALLNPDNVRQIMNLPAPINEDVDDRPVSDDGSGYGAEFGSGF